MTSPPPVAGCDAKHTLRRYYGPEFTSTALDAWAYTRRVELRFILISLWPLLGGTWVSHPVASSAPSP